ncbi:phospholipid/cholesterol/gamma-HCH transport system substrate-binding protein [Nonomuraea solani]|uniref:Phospholipid/cholesterol/gamma-HCH transport system substrate-binding protein n=1 Tax=Nonomuraea solani TaxID=1144553 RepID=A0A1H6DDY5_9ACTN|nr:MlaD family protein [Nonomuraea solani]SEG82756.1 phospholipid/cholesterol/gamma-HCH transport system substrate-binding protein [Nonomuraea solani]
MARSELSLAARVGIALAVLAVFAAATLYVVRTATQLSGTRIDAVFTRSGQGLDTNSPVKIRGITVGDVTGIDLDAKGRAVVTMHLDPGVRVPESTVASVEPTSVFGPKFVNLKPGTGETTGPYLGAGAVITATEGPLDLSDTLGDAYKGLDAVDPREVTVIVHTLAKGLEGEGGNLRELIDDAGTLVGVAHRQRERARRFLRDAALLGTALSDKGDDLIAISSDVNVITPDLLKRADKVRALLQELTSISGQVSHGLAGHRGDLRAGVHSGERVAALIYAQLGLAGGGVRGLTRLVDLLNELIEAPGPNGSRQLQVEAFVATDVCELIVGACGPTDGRR